MAAFKVPHNEYPAAPPAKIRVIARPTVCNVAPLAVSTNGKNNKNPIRVALSITPMLVSNGNASGCRWRANSVLSESGRAAPGALSRRGAVNRIAAAMAMPTPPRINSAGRHGVTSSISESIAGSVIFPTSPAKL